MSNTEGVSTEGARTDTGGAGTDTGGADTGGGGSDMVRQQLLS